MDLSQIASEVQRVAGTVGQVNEVVQDLKTGKKKIAIVPGSGPSFVVSKADSSVAFGISATPILVLFGVLLYAVSTRKSR